MKESAKNNLMLCKAKRLGQEIKKKCKKAGNTVGMCQKKGVNQGEDCHVAQNAGYHH